MNTYTGTGYDKIEKRTTYVMQHPGLHKGKSVRVVADKPILVGDRINHGNYILIQPILPVKKVIVNSFGLFEIGFNFTS